MVLRSYTLSCEVEMFPNWSYSDPDAAVASQLGLVVVTLYWIGFALYALRKADRAVLLIPLCLTVFDVTWARSMISECHSPDHPSTFCINEHDDSCMENCPTTVHNTDGEIVWVPSVLSAMGEQAWSFSFLQFLGIPLLILYILLRDQGQVGSGKQEVRHKPAGGRR